MSCLPCAQLQPELALLNACYPPAKQLLASAPDFRPLSQDLSKLTYFASNKPSKLARIGQELESHVLKEASRSSSGNAKSRASLLISLAILRALLSECKRDINLFAKPAMRIISTSLDVKVYQKGNIDIEVVGRASSCFVAYATFTDGVAIGVDDALTSAYLAVLSKFAALAVYTPPSEKLDVDQQNRIRLIGLAALDGASSSDSVFGSSAEFPRQVTIIVPALLSNIGDGSLSQLKAATGEANEAVAPSPYFREFAAIQPVNVRRVSSLYAQLPGEKSPSTGDVFSAALHSLISLVNQCGLDQITQVLDAVIIFLDSGGWTDVERCCWLAEQLTEFMMLQFRFSVPTRLVEMLSELSDDSPPTHKHSSALAMVTKVLNSDVSLAGLAVSDILANLIAIIIRRVTIDPQDALLPPLVQCVASLGTHIHYADQINDIVEEIAAQIAQIPADDPARSEILRVLIHCIINVMITAGSGDKAEARTISPTLDKGKGPLLETPALEAPRRSLGRRNPIAPEVWQETLPLLCESKFAVRAAYARALILFLQTEIPSDHKPQPNEPNILRFCNALHATVYTLAMSSSLGTGSPIQTESNSPSDSPKETPKASPKSSPKLEQKTLDTPPKAVTFDISEPTPDVTSNGETTPQKKVGRTARRVSLPLNSLNSKLSLGSFENVATPFDFGAIVKILEDLHAAVPVAALTSGIPMLLALDRNAGTELVRRPGDGCGEAYVIERKRACREVVLVIWKRASERWGVTSALEVINKAINTLPEPFIVPDLRTPPLSGEGLPPPDQPSAFYRDETQGESSAASQPMLDPEILVSAFASSPSIQTGSMQDAAVLMRRFTANWTVETAIQDSVERTSSPMAMSSNFTNYGVTNAFMDIPSSSHQGSARPQSRAIDVTDLREALGGRDAVADSSSYPPSVISTTGTAAMPEDLPKKPTVAPDVKGVLKEIFKDKKNLTAKATSVA